MCVCVCVCVGLVWAIARGSANMGTDPCTLYTPITCNCSLSQKSCSSVHIVSAMLPRVPFWFAPFNSGVSVPCNGFHCLSGNKIMREFGRLITLLRIWKFWVQSRTPAILKDPQSLPDRCCDYYSKWCPDRVSPTVIFRYSLMRQPLENCNVSLLVCARNDLPSNTTLTVGICQWLSTSEWVT